MYPWRTWDLDGPTKFTPTNEIPWDFQDSDVWDLVSARASTGRLASKYITNLKEPNAPSLDDDLVVAKVEIFLFYFMSQISLVTSFSIKLIVDY